MLQKPVLPSPFIPGLGSYGRLHEGKTCPKIVTLKSSISCRLCAVWCKTEVTETMACFFVFFSEKTSL